MTQCNTYAIDILVTIVTILLCNLYWSHLISFLTSFLSISRLQAVNLCSHAFQKLYLETPRADCAYSSMKHILTGAMFMDRTCCQRTRVAPKGSQNQDALYSGQSHRSFGREYGFLANWYHAQHWKIWYRKLQWTQLLLWIEVNWFQRELFWAPPRHLLFISGNQDNSTVQPFISARNQIIVNIYEIIPDHFLQNFHWMIFGRNK